MRAAAEALKNAELALKEHKGMAGGKKIEFHSSLIIQLKRVKTLTRVTKGLKVKYGIISRALVKKNHLSQSETSLHQLDFEITASGASVSSEKEDEESED